MGKCIFQPFLAVHLNALTLVGKSLNPASTVVSDSENSLVPGDPQAFQFFAVPLAAELLQEGVSPRLVAVLVLAPASTGTGLVPAHAERFPRILKGTGLEHLTCDFLSFFSGHCSRGDDASTKIESFSLFPGQLSHLARPLWEFLAPTTWPSCRIPTQ